MYVREREREWEKRMSSKDVKKNNWYLCFFGQIQVFCNVDILSPTYNNWSSKKLLNESAILIISPRLKSKHDFSISGSTLIKRMYGIELQFVPSSLNWLRRNKTKKYINNKNFCFCVFGRVIKMNKNTSILQTKLSALHVFKSVIWNIVIVHCILT